MPRFIWNNISPPKVQFLSWLVWKGRVKTSVFLHHIGVLRGEDVTQCIFCKSDLETVNHVLLLCPFSWKIWSAIIDWWGLFWVCLALLWICLSGGLAQNLRRKNYTYGKSSHLLLFGQFGSSGMIVFSTVPSSTSWRSLSL